MGWEDIRVSPNQLAVVKRIAVPIETRYMQERLFIPLRKKYRPPYGSASQYGCGGDWSGKTQHKAKTSKTKVEQPKKMVMKVNGATGHSVMVEG